MFSEIFDGSVLNLVYVALVAISFLFALLSLIGAGIGDIFDFAFDSDTDFDFINISPFALASFGSSFGGIGLIARIVFEVEPVFSLLWAVVGGVLIGGLAHVFFIYVLSATKSGHFSLDKDAVGREVEVTVTIPDTGLGTVAYNNTSGRMTLGARSLNGKIIPTGSLVIIEKIVGRVALVRPAGEKKS